MSKSIKPKNNVYIDSTGIVHNRKLLSQIINEIGLIAHPVGSIYISVNSTNPRDIFGGTWVQIKDRFLLACGNTYSNGATGGEATHKLTVDEMPKHTHEYADRMIIWDADGNNTNVQWRSNWDNTSVRFKSWGTTTMERGGDQAHNNMPPYLAVYVWKRTA